MLWVSLFILSLSTKLSLEDEDFCSQPLGMSTNTEGITITSHAGDSTAPSMGRLNNSEGAWCFSNTTVTTGTAVLEVEFAKDVFVSGVATQGPPKSLFEPSYNHLLAFSVNHSLDGRKWIGVNGGNSFFTQDKNDTSEEIFYHMGNSIELARHVRFVISGISDHSGIELCLRFEIYGCTTGVVPRSYLKAKSTSSGQLYVTWEIPTARVTLGEEDDYLRFSASEYILSYQYDAKDEEEVITSVTEIFLQSLQLAAKYELSLKCAIEKVKIDCGSISLTAFPPCDDGWLPQRSHCYHLKPDYSSFEDVYMLCRDSYTSVGPLGKADEILEQKYVTEKLLDGNNNLWLVDISCNSTSHFDCCQKINVEPDGSWTTTTTCDSAEELQGVCVRDNTGQGSPLRAVGVEAVDDTTVRLSWKNDGKGWRTNQIIAKVWKDNGDSKSYAVPTMNEYVEIDTLQPGVIYSLSLKPGFNIVANESILKFTIIDFEEIKGEGGAAQYGGFLCSVFMEAYLYWNGTIKVSWSEAVASAVGQTHTSWMATSYVIANYAALDDEVKANSRHVKETNFLMTQIFLETEYKFNLECNFVKKLFPCGSIQLSTGLPDKIRETNGYYAVYQVANQAMKWQDAENYCSKRNGHLVSFNDEDELEEVRKLIPEANPFYWTGAKLLQSGRDRWTDGSRIGYFPISSRNSGVTSASKPCLSTTMEETRMRVIGRSCEDSLPFICEFKEHALVNPPEGFMLNYLSPSAINISWNDPSTLWRPTYYDVLACIKKICQKYGSRIKEYQLSITNLTEFTDYKIQIVSILNPLNLKATFSTYIMTEPTNPVRYILSSEGVLTMSSLLLISHRRSQDMTLVTLTEASGSNKMTSRDKAENVTSTGLIPGRTYDVTMKTEESQSPWEHSFSLDAYPTCPLERYRILQSCYWIASEEESCEKLDGFVSKPSSLRTLKSLQSVIKDIPFKIDRRSLDPNENDKLWNEKCSGSNLVCCSFVNDDVKCSCCENVNSVLCQSDITAKLGQVEDVRTTNITYESVALEWRHPLVSWTIPSYRVKWRPLVDIERKRDKGEVVTNSTNLEIGRLRSEAPYEIIITPKSGETLSGNDTTMTIITLKDPRIPARLDITTDGFLTLTSPKLKDMGRENEVLNITIYETNDPSDILKTKQSPANDITIVGLSPSVNYTVITKSVDDSLEDIWHHSFTFLAYPTCTGDEYQLAEKCYWVLNDKYIRSAADGECEAQNGMLFTPVSKSDLTSLKSYLESIANTTYWVNVSPSTFQKAEILQKKCPGDETFDSAAKCCSYNVLSEVTTCSCCSEEKMAVCEKTVTADLGKVRNYRVTNITYDTVSIKWEPPQRFWNIQSYQIMWKAKNFSKRKKDKGVITVYKLEARVVHLKPERSYVISVAPHAEDYITGDYVEEAVKTVKDTRIPLQYKINEDGKMTISSPKLIDMGRSAENLNVILFEVDDQGNEKPIKEINGPANRTVLTGLKPAVNYTIKVISDDDDDDEDDTFNHNTSFVALPTCEPGQIQYDLECFWVPKEKKSWKEALALCRRSGGELIDPSSTNSSLLQSVVKTLSSNMWTYVSKSVTESTKPKPDCSNSVGEDMLCCSCDVYSNGTTGNVICSCCDEEKSFSCKSSKKLTFGFVRNLRALNTLEDSITISWDPPNKSWQNLSYLINWYSKKDKVKRATNNLIVETEKAVISELRPGTSYVIEVSPYANGIVTDEVEKLEISTSTLNLGEVRELKILNLTETSLTLTWGPPTRTWNDMAYLVTWTDKTELRKRRETQQMLVKEGEVTVSSLKPETRYEIGVAPYVDNAVVGGTKVIRVTTIPPPGSFFHSELEGDDSDPLQTLMLARIICCTWITFLVGLVLVIYIVFGMFFQDCLAQLCAELGLIAAYTCILLADERIGDPSSQFRITLCTATAIFLQFFFQAVFLFMLLEVIAMCRLITPCFSPNILTKPWSLLLLGWGIPCIITGLSAIIVGRDYVKTTQNCWLELSGAAMAPTVVPICIFIVLQALLFILVFFAADIRDNITAPQDLKRAQVFFSSRWASACIFILTVAAWATGIVGIDKRDYALTIAFVVVSFFLGVFILVLRVISDDLLRQRINDWLKKNKRPHRTNKVNTWPATIIDTNDPLETRVKRTDSSFGIPQTVYHE